MRLHASIAAALVLATAPLGARADEPAAALADPPLVLTVAPGSAGGPWKMKVQNTGEVPVRIAADARLLTLEVTPPAGSPAEAALKKRGAKPGEPVIAKCELPADARPATDEGRELVVPGKRSFSLSFDPLFYCFGVKERGALVSGATVKARFGFAAPAAKAVKGKSPSPTSPFVAAPVGAAVGKLAPAKAIESAPFTLSEDVKVADATPATGEGASTPGVEVTTSETLDVSRGSEITVTVTVTNTSDHAVTTLFRPEMLRFSVSGPAGTVRCGSTRTVASPIRELFGTLGVKGKTSISVLVTSLCGFDTFDEAGLYRVTATFDSSGASGQSIRLKTWDGEATAKRPLLLRVRTPKRPRTTSRPSLD
ncbi:MAG: hypothetical protein JST00_45960 [Deltaproteobacteria bacterium]|nr:hypothetical protein [Deltaproteobacteria bacterium]